MSHQNFTDLTNQTFPALHHVVEAKDHVIYPDMGLCFSRQKNLNTQFKQCKQTEEFPQFCFELVLISTLKLEVVISFVLKLWKATK